MECDLDFVCVYVTKRTSDIHILVSIVTIVTEFCVLREVYILVYILLHPAYYSRPLLLGFMFSVRYALRQKQTTRWQHCDGRGQRNSYDGNSVYEGCLESIW